GPKESSGAATGRSSCARRSSDAPEPRAKARARSTAPGRSTKASTRGVDGEAPTAPSDRSTSPEKPSFRSDAITASQLALARKARTSCEDPARTLSCGEECHVLNKVNVQTVRAQPWVGRESFACRLSRQ